MSQTIKLSEIKIGTRQRKDLGDIAGLARSISIHGLIQPPVLDDDNNLIAGERRYRACELLGLESIEFVRKGALPEDIREELEFEENFRRKSMTWVEESLGILSIYRKKKLKGALEGFEENWTETVAEMFGMSVGSINYILVIAKKLELELTKPPNERPYHQSNSVNDAYRNVFLAEQMDQANRLIAQRSQANISQTTNKKREVTVVEQERVLVVEVKNIQSSPDLLQAERDRYTSNPLNNIPFNQYWKEKCAKAEEIKNTIYISSNFIHGDSITFMNDPENAGRFDHIITDIPYGIEMDNLDQGAEGSMQDIGRVKRMHDVNENLLLMANFFPAAFQCTKEKAFVVTCCDIENWELMCKTATAAGFVYQSWPYIWRKVNQSVKNEAAGYNTTKDYEIVMICRKPASTLMSKRNTSFTDAGNTLATKETGHPFAKPYELTKHLTEMVSLKGQTILDPFAGCGSMVIEMLRQERNVVAVEKEEHHYNALLSNVKNLFYLKLNPSFIFK